MCFEQRNKEVCRIAEQGNHEQLMRQDGIYRRFVDSSELAIGWKV